MYYFATLFDKNYLSRALVMINSLLETNQEKNILFYVLALDQDVVEYFKYSKYVETITLQEIEISFPELKKAKDNRSYVEYLFTLSPFLPLYILLNKDNIARITTLDADLLFLSSPTVIIDKLGENKIGITLHDFPDLIKYLETYGRYNVSFQSFPKTNNSINCIKNWAKNCIEYSGDKLDEFGNFADQKYLDNWQLNFADVVDFETGCIGLAPWNIKKYNLKWVNDTLYASEKKVIFFHFHGFRIIDKNCFRHALENYNKDFSTLEIKKLYIKYWSLLNMFNQNIDVNVQRFTTKKSKYKLIDLFNNLIKYALAFKIYNYWFFVDFHKISHLKSRINGKNNKS